MDVQVTHYAIGRPGELVLRYTTNPLATVLAADEVIVPLTDAPELPHVISIDGRSALAQQPSLDVVKLLRLRDARDYRDRCQASGCTTAIGRLDTDSESMIEINTMAAAASAAIAQKVAFPYTTFTCADGTKVAITPTKGVAAQVKVAGMRNACQDAYLVVKAKINAAADAAGVAAIDITAGYPAS